MAKKSKNARVPASPRESAMEDGQSGLLPKLRFPEFVDEPIRTASLGEVTEECTGRRGKQLTSAAIMGVSKADGIVPMEERLIGKDTTRHKLLSPDWFAYNPMRINIGSIARWRGDCDVLVSPDYMVFRCIDDHESGISADYLDQFRSSLQWERFVSGNGDGGVRIRIYYKDLALLSMGLPSLLEQRKIASCLSTLDELIGSQGRKVAALRIHKKGLMQQLFPREGETQPRLRFPEFQDAGDWEVKPLGKVAENLDSQRVPITSSDRKAGSIPYYGASGIVDYVDGFIFDEELLCVSEDGANLVARNYPIAFPISGKTWVNNHAHVLRFDNPYRQKFIELYLNLIKLDDFITGMAQPKLNRTMLDRIPIPFPDISEQQRIASCLSSLDELITAETQKLEALKTHKRGLMQQLFPSPEDAS
jgi:type I restriction enzyme S subunit